MGTITAKEKSESKMLMLKLKKIQIRRERIDRIKQLKALTGKEKGIHDKNSEDNKMRKIKTIFLNECNNLLNSSLNDINI